MSHRGSARPCCPKKAGVCIGYRSDVTKTGVAGAGLLPCDTDSSVCQKKEAAQWDGVYKDLGLLTS